MRKHLNHHTVEPKITAPFLTPSLLTASFLCLVAMKMLLTLLDKVRS